MKRTPVALAVVLTAAVAVSGCAPSANSAAPSPDSESSMTVVLPDTNITLSLDNGFGGLEVLTQLNATLIRKPYEESSIAGNLQQNVNEYEPYLADSWEMSDDGLTYTFHLGDAVSAAGNEISSDDVLWSWERRFNTPTSAVPSMQKPQITSLDQFTKIDDKTFSITVEQPGYGATLLALLADLTSWIYDSTYLQEHATPDDPYAVKWSAENANYGFGPYELTSYESGSGATLEAREDFVLGEPDIDEVVMRIVPDAGNRANLVRTGDADFAMQVLPADLVDLEAGEGTKTGRVDDPNAYLMMPLVTNKPPFDDALVRQAMAYAVPYDQIIENVYHGMAVRNGPGFVRTDHPGYSDDGLEDFTFDPEKARELLTEAGHPDGVSFELTVDAAQPAMQATAIQIQTFAKEAGFDVQINQVPASGYGAGRSDHSFQSFLLQDWAITLTPSYELNIYTAPGGTNNLADWANDEFLAAKAAGDALPDPYTDEAGEAWNAAERILVNEAPILFIAQVQPNVAMSDDVQGFAWRSDNRIDFSSMSIDAD